MQQAGAAIHDVVGRCGRRYQGLLCRHRRRHKVDGWELGREIHSRHARPGAARLPTLSGASFCPSGSAAGPGVTNRRRPAQYGRSLCAPRRQRLSRDARRHCQRRLLGIPFHGGAGPPSDQLDDRDGDAAQCQEGRPGDSGGVSPKHEPFVSGAVQPAADRTMLKSPAVSSLVLCCPPAPGKRCAPGSDRARRR